MKGNLLIFAIIVIIISGVGLFIYYDRAFPPPAPTQVMEYGERMTGEGMAGESMPIPAADAE